jgi:hypothetical protein
MSEMLSLLAYGKFVALNTGNSGVVNRIELPSYSSASDIDTASEDEKAAEDEFLKTDVSSSTSVERTTLSWSKIAQLRSAPGSHLSRG